MNRHTHYTVSVRYDTIPEPYWPNTSTGPGTNTGNLGFNHNRKVLYESIQKSHFKTNMYPNFLGDCMIECFLDPWFFSDTTTLTIFYRRPIGASKEGYKV